MPPLNTPTAASPTTQSPASPQSQSPAHNRPLTPLSYLSSPVADLAATLYTQAAEEAEEANTSFLRDSLESLDQASQPVSRTHVDPQRDPRRTGQPEAAQATTARSSTDTAEDLSRRERLQRVLARLNRLHDPAASSTSAYTNRTPSPHRQSLYDWAPSYDEHHQDDNELDAILNELRRQQPDTHPDILRVLSQSQLGGHRQAPPREGSGTPAPANSAELEERRERLRERERRRRENEWVSLRTRAAIQRARSGEGSPSATDRMLRYVMERERSGMSEEEERARGTGWFRPSPSRGSNEEHRSAPPGRDSWLLPPPASDVRDRDRQERVEAFRRGYLAENVPPRLPRIATPPPAPTVSLPPSTSSTFLESALKYLSDLRSCSRYEDSLSTAIDHGLATKEFFADKHDDFIMDLKAMDPLQHSSWLQPGTVFDGHQHATNGCGSSGLTHHSRSSPGIVTHVVEQINPNFGSRTTTTGFDHPPGSTRVTPFDATRPWLSHQFTPPTLHPLATSKHAPEPQHDRWPVRVILHAVNPDAMTLQGTMEAYDVPQHPASLSILNSDRPKAGKKGAPITTYLEGHIIDLTTHSFLTPGSPDGKKTGPHLTSSRNATPYTTSTHTVAFPAATAHTDAANWRKLPPFNQLPSDDETARLLLSQARMQEVNEQYIFMRWKERCFVHGKDDKCDAADRSGDQDRGHGLTISGFYYISLRRSDGVVEGLYFDPTSTPYQHLRLTGQQTGWPAFEFR
ncbi:hypothetical protein LTR36_007459 [Oleoguttula mirabilis]|uniref:Vacuolar import and degradation protein-domain-containing protein n=1 Tax=Oleoguttula mirabilis TaxID=1507867 RepID=A0AAV9J9K9_9PEZI|nr:hypothetical protein LTR36_007459 [Oleoguttula mirabilis]